ncbi:MAG: hypothetical protein U0174_26845 [Polyangiaceae bacterium]
MVNEAREGSEAAGDGARAGLLPLKPESRLPSWAAGWLPRVVFVLVAAIAFSPAVRTPYLLDDYLHACMIEGTFPVHRGPTELYDFVSDGDRETLRSRGVLPWWSDAGLKIRFLRPLPSLLRFGEHRFFGSSPFLFHLHSFAWWGMAVLAARRLFRKLLSPRASAIATLVFALAPCHTLPLAWLANREALVSLTFGTLGLSSYLSFRQTRTMQGAVTSAAFFTLAFLSGEYAVCFFGYVLAFEFLWSARERLVVRVVRAMPFLGPAAAYLALRAVRGYGTRGSAFYADPFSAPADFLRSAPRRLLTMLVDAWFSLDGESLNSKTPLWVLGLLCAFAFLVLLGPFRKAIAALPEAEGRATRALLLGSVLCLAPVLAVVPSSRLLGAAVLGLSAPVAVLLTRAWYDAPQSTNELGQFAALAMGFAHLVHAPITAFSGGLSLRAGALVFQEQATSLRAQLKAPADAELVTMRGFGGSFFLPFALGVGAVPPKQWRILSQTGHVLVEREGPKVLRLTVPKDSSAFPTGVGNLFRPERATFKPGDTLSVPGLHVKVLAVSKTGPSVLLFEFEQELERSSVVWVTESRAGFRETPPPEVGFGVPID